jgi:hypothetical protein
MVQTRRVSDVASTEQVLCALTQSECGAKETPEDTKRYVSININGLDDVPTPPTVTNHIHLESLRKLARSKH